jgi:GntR family transcriptional regulator
VTVDPRSDRPIYRQIADILRAQIANGTLQPGQMLPSEKHLADAYGVGRDAIRQAIASLRIEGLAVTGKGRGTLVRLASERTPLVLTPATRAIVRMPSAAERAELNIDEGVPVIVVSDGRASPRLYAADRVFLTGA